jgi:hypothetical protein
MATAEEYQRLLAQFDGSRSAFDRITQNVNFNDQLVAQDGDWANRTGAGAGKTYGQALIDTLGNVHAPGSEQAKDWAANMERAKRGDISITDYLGNYGRTKGLIGGDYTFNQSAAQAPDPNQQGPRGVKARIQYDAAGRPIRNDYQTMTDKDGNLLSQYRVGDKIGDDINVDKTAMNQLQARATSQGPSAWAQMSKQKLAMEQAGAINKNQRQAQAGLNQGLTSLAGRGGVSAGQKALLASQAARGRFAGDQGIRQQGLMGNLGIDMQDDQTKTQLLSQLPGMQLNQANFDQSQRAYRNTAMDLDNQRAMKDIAGFNAYNADAYSKAMQEWGAGKTADAQARSGGGGKK